MPTRSGHGPPPSRDVRTAFGCGAHLEPLPGGRASSWRAGRVVLKPLDMDPQALRWQAAVLSRLDGRPDFRVSVPLTSVTGALVVEGWTAWRFEAGQHLAGRWTDIVEAGASFHAATAAERRPPFLELRTDPWALADRFAWGELPAHGLGHLGYAATLVDALEPLDAAPQLIHGDLTGNVLFAAGRSPLVIDLSPYWRPAGFAAAVVVADAVVFEGAGRRLVDAFSGVRDFGQLLLRALIYRMVTDRLARPDEPAASDDPYLPACRLALALTTAGR